WSYQTQHAYGELWTAIGHDKKNEVMILTCTDPYWLVHESDPSSFDEVENGTDVNAKFNVNIPDTMNFVENFINDIEIPTIAAINGQGMHYEFALMSDITLCVPEYSFSDAHFSKNIVGGDGMSFAMRTCLGVKQSNYFMFMEPQIPAAKALEMGLVNEVVEHDKLIERAYEIAHYLMKTDRSVRRLQHEIAIRPWKQSLQDNERIHVLCEMYGVQLNKFEHHFDKIVESFDAKRDN
ncbi:MAG: enoyl-CoA hydratase/isomerase family protein, partial [Oscillospiraceae bacterium]|nr:enoyl-CoA hydratase/isomerase family protein [Oscillospiraceae bacterium]